MGRKGIIVKYLILFAVLAGISWPSDLRAQTYPRGPVQIVIPFAPGGSTDLLWRGISDSVAKNLGAPISLINKGGGGGIVGTSFVMGSKPDGYTLVSANSDPLNIAPLFTPEPLYDPEKDLTYIAKMAVFAFTIAVRSESPFKTFEELIAFAKANPGKLKAGVAGVGTTPHMIVELLNRDAKIQITPVPFSGGGEVVPNLLGGHVDLTVLSLGPLKGHFLSGKVRILALFSPKRHRDFPQIPTMAEKGFPAANIATGVGLAGPKGLPTLVVKKWEETIEKTMREPKVQDVIDKLESLVIDVRNGEAYKKEILTDLAAFKPIVATLPGKK